MATPDSSIIAYFGGDTSGLTKALAEAGQKTGEFAKKIGTQVAGTQQMSQALATALGINIQTMGEHVARFITGLSKESEKALAELVALSDRAADLTIQNMRANLSDEQRYQIALKERDRIMRDLEASVAAVATKQITVWDAMKGVHTVTVEAEKTAEQLVATKRLEVALAEKNLEIGNFERKQKQETAKLTTDALADETKFIAARGEAERKAKMEGLSLSEREAEIREEIAALQASLNDGTLEAKQLQQQRNTLLQREQELGDVVNQQAREHMAAQDELAKLQFERLSAEEKIVGLEKVEAEITRNIGLMKAEGLDVTQAQIALLETQNRLASLRAETEKRTVDHVREQAAAVEKAAEAARSYVADLVTGQYALRKDPRDIEGASDEELRELVRRAKAEVAKIWAEERANLNAASIASGHFGAKLAQIPFTADISAAEAELSRRQSLRSAAGSPGGIEAARRSFTGNVLNFDEYMRSVTEGHSFQRETAETLRRIDGTLRSVFTR